ncbi:MAG: hypothetical protein KDN05_18690, partial [Verrucomicrobiae bacterium]|nr:hypothetical protein [Verrucomicrobiae bacterium]
MQDGDAHKLDFGHDQAHVSQTRKPQGLTISANAGKALSPAQVEFNKRMKALENARAAHERERARLDNDLRVCHSQFMP